MAARQLSLLTPHWPTSRLLHTAVEGVRRDQRGPLRRAVRRFRQALRRLPTTEHSRTAVSLVRGYRPPISSVLVRRRRPVTSVVSGAGQ